MTDRAAAVSSWLHDHWARALICAALAGLVFYTVFLYSGRSAGIPRLYLVAYALSVALLLVQIVTPRVGGVAMSALAFAAGAYTLWRPWIGSPFSVGGIMPMPLIWTAGLMAFTASLWLAVSCCLALCCSYVLPWIVFLPSEGLMVPDGEFAMACMAAFCVGYALKMSVIAKRRAHVEAENAELRAETEHLRRLRDNVRLQRLIHDAVAGELSYIVLATRASRGHSPIPIDAIHGRAQRALAHTREAIVLLAEDTDDVDIAMLAPTEVGKRIAGVSADWLVRYTAAQDDDLRAIGLHGGTDVSVDADAPEIGDTLRNSVCNLLRELYANIAVHGDRDGGWYAVAIHVTATELRIRADNEIGAGPLDDLLHSGTGLDSQRRFAEGHDGSLDVFHNDDLFRVCVELPL